MITINGHQVVRGTFWAVRNGQVVKISQINVGSDYPAVHDMGQGLFHACSRTGKSCIDNDEWDLICPSEGLPCECNKCRSKP